MQRSPWLHYLLVASTVAVLAFTMRLPGLGDFMTADEENWLLRSATFWHELFRQGDPTGTFLTTHPGAATMWLAGAGITWQEHRLGFDIDTSNVKEFRPAALWPLVITTSVLVGTIAALMSSVTSKLTGWLSGTVLATDPYLTGLSQIVHLDALVALLMILSAVLFLKYLLTRQQPLLIWTGVVAGLAMSNKLLPALWLLPFFGLATLLVERTHSPAKLWRTVTTVSFIASIAILTFIIAWPAAWSQADSPRSFQRDVPSVITDAHSESTPEEATSTRSFYIRTILGRTPPYVLLMALAALLLAILLKRTEANTAFFVWYWLLFATGFSILISNVAKKGDRYALPGLLAIGLLASWATVKAWPLLKRRLPAPLLARPWVPPAVVALVVAGLLVQRLGWGPYALAYDSFWNVRPLPQQGWGEGLDAAAQWLNEQPRAHDMHIASWYPSITAQYFTGTTLSLSSRHDDRVAYVVLYRNMQGRGGGAADIWQEYAAQEPAHIVRIHGQPYVWVYEQIGLPYFDRHVGELRGETEVGQTITPTHNNWRSISLGLSSFSSRANTHDVVLHIRAGLAATDDIRTVVVNARDIADQAYHTFTFEPLPDSAGQTYYVALTSPTSVPGDAITVRFSTTDLLPGQMVWRRQALAPGETNEAFVRAGDIAYHFTEDAYAP